MTNVTHAWRGVTAVQTRPEERASGFEPPLTFPLGSWHVTPDYAGIRLLPGRNVPN